MWSILNPEQPHCYLAVYPLNMTSHRLPCCPSSNLTRHTAAMCFLSKSDQSHCCYLVLCLNVSLPCGLLSKHEQPNRHHVFFVVKIRPATPLLLGLLSKRDQPHCRRAVLCLSHVAAIWSMATLRPYCPLWKTARHLAVMWPLVKIRLATLSQCGPLSKPDQQNCSLWSSV
jgi:hypothetical protein